MILLVEEILGYIKYTGQNNAVKKDHLSIELRSDRWNMPLPNNWDCEIQDPRTETKIYVQGFRPPFIIEGSDYFYYVPNQNDIQSISKNDLFFEAINNTIASDIIETAYLNGYDTSEAGNNEKMIRAASIILKNAEKSVERIVFRIPYLLGVDFNTFRNDPDYSKMPKFYVISSEKLNEIAKALAVSIGERFGIDFPSDSIPQYSFNWFI